jgi:hypothetical protein
MKIEHKEPVDNSSPEVSLLTKFGQFLCGILGGHVSEYMGRRRYKLANKKYITWGTCTKCGKEYIVDKTV